jgi:signal transduction histidine kinase
MRGLVSSATEATSLEAALAADEMDAVDLSALVADRVLAFQQLHPSRQLLLSLKPGLFIHGNEERLAQLLDKLLNNAVEHSAPDAEIRVAFRRTENHWIELNVENECDPLPEDKERIFEAFVSSQRRPENLGLGLFVAQSIACNHGGRIFAEDLPGGRGARFVVRLPEAAKETSAAEVKASRVERIHRPARDEDQPPQ